jgi:hypothetical protein
MFHLRFHNELALVVIRDQNVIVCAPFSDAVARNNIPKSLAIQVIAPPTSALVTGLVGQQLRPGMRT